MPKQMKVEQLNLESDVIAERIRGKSIRQIARDKNVSKSAVHRYLTQSSALNLLTSKDRTRLQEVLSTMILNFRTNQNILQDKIVELDKQGISPSILKGLKDMVNATQNLNDKSLRMLKLLLPSKQVSVKEMEMRERNLINLNDLRFENLD